MDVSVIRHTTCDFYLFTAAISGVIAAFFSAHNTLLLTNLKILPHSFSKSKDKMYLKFPIIESFSTRIKKYIIIINAIPITQQRTTPMSSFSFYKKMFFDNNKGCRRSLSYRQHPYLFEVLFHSNRCFYTHDLFCFTRS